LGAALDHIERLVQRLFGGHQLLPLRGQQHRQRDARLRAAIGDRCFHDRSASAVRPST